MLKKLFVIMCILGMTLHPTIVTYAQEVDVDGTKIEPRIEVIDCPNCTNGVIPKSPVYSSIEAAHKESFPCVHGTHTYDIYEVYEIEKYQQCTSCGYKLVIDHVENHEYLYCSNSYFG